MRTKVVFVGSTHVGKTSIIGRFITGSSNLATQPTTQGALHHGSVRYLGREWKLDIWDTAGQEQDHALSPMYYRDADVAVVVCDLTDHKSFRDCDQWISELRQSRGYAASVIIVGNKSDLTSERKVAFNQLLHFADSCQVEAFETSAKTGANIDELFEMMIRLVLERGDGDTRNATVQRRRVKSSVTFESLPPPERECC
jgi:small GTP-binding protein